MPIFKSEQFDKSDRLCYEFIHLEICIDTYVIIIIYIYIIYKYIYCYISLKFINSVIAASNITHLVITTLQFQHAPYVTPNTRLYLPYKKLT